MTITDTDLERLFLTAIIEYNDVRIKRAKQGKVASSKESFEIGFNKWKDFAREIIEEGTKNDK